jgi:hypothetical protein
VGSFVEAMEMEKRIVQVLFFLLFLWGSKAREIHGYFLQVLFCFFFVCSSLRWILHARGLYLGLLIFVFYLQVDSLIFCN